MTPLQNYFNGLRDCTDLGPAEHLLFGGDSRHWAMLSAMLSHVELGLA